jgi:hypothetical protein
VEVRCVQNKIKYARPKGVSSGPLVSSVMLGDISRNESRNFSCPQVVFDLKFLDRALTPEEIRALYEAGKKTLDETGRPPGEDQPFEWADPGVKRFVFALVLAPAVASELPSGWQTFTGRVIHLGTGARRESILIFAPAISPDVEV